MKELTSLDLFYLLKEFKELEGAKIDQIYVSKDVILRMHVPNQGKIHLRINSKFIFLTDFKEEQSSPGGFCMALRKWLVGARIEAIEQVGFERVLRFVFKNVDVYVELFGKGNVIVLQEGKVVAAKNKIPQIYSPPKKDVDARSIKRSEFNELMKAEEKVVLVLAKSLGLGGVYAKIALEGFDTQLPANEFKSKEVEKIFETIQGLFKKKIDPSLFEGHILPFAKGLSLKESLYNKAIENYALVALEQEEHNKKNASYLAKKEKLEKIVQSQEQAISEHEQLIATAARKGELIYENYSQVKEAIDCAKKKQEHPLIKKTLARKIVLEL